MSQVRRSHRLRPRKIRDQPQAGLSTITCTDVNSDPGEVRHARRCRRPAPFGPAGVPLLRRKDVLFTTAGIRAGGSEGAESSVSRMHNVVDEEPLARGPSSPPLMAKELAWPSSRQASEVACATLGVACATQGSDLDSPKRAPVNRRGQISKFQPGLSPSNFVALGSDLDFRGPSIRPIRKSRSDPRGREPQLHRRVAAR
jgi:hypothetical protein